ncbi:2-oxoglutarate:acceptor oxidoreductase [Campylobacter hepaticus]|uniref:2-oxoglutarate:acceptor oxidoreductase n=1 Tax=Campylobacter hepaticus TaxID=1813019 RepID=A0A424Z303_9BACT|nr:2-oxoglutarate:acceptor oxidoreductase [Campylobacter hepaticus]AXP08657.1 2-oxoglutarate:acceptor oxidoreductase [Campylobacter hepaticus]MCZ0772500.1 2-oxoglutarate:acceptor oxidoreductase [Campylobacter hepaticus]MCZ0773968.1 2-oxoglutarate:acceptor oxidoreductase [Campylobacter hepaticus]MCZ0775220.1 2-oxoglutarate:acceptor oxidoreductase [Campylobacter hepaticus]MDX2323279.1 2-oxoglutarate:acceptor oxidoreductase [Campylobacter hepaticus]
MNLEDLAKKTISEVSSIMEEQRKQNEILKDQDQKITIKDEFICEEIENKEKLSNIISLEELQENQIIQNDTIKDENIQQKEIKASHLNFTTQVSTINEDIFLKNLRERILVLFEGLNSIEQDQIENRVNLTINFLEFLLANIEDKLKK